MRFTISESLSFVFRDPRWPGKLIMGAVFVLLSIVLVGIPILYGYLVELLERTRRGDKFPLPEWNHLGTKFVVGLKYITTFVIYAFPVLVLLLPLVFMLIATSIFGPEPHASQFGTAALIAFLAVLTVPYSLALTAITPIVSIRFSERGSIEDALHLGQIVRVFRHCWQDAVVAELAVIGLSILATIGIAVFVVGIFATTFYISLVRFHLYGQLARTIHGKLVLE